MRWKRKSSPEPRSLEGVHGFRLFDAFERVVREVIPIEHRDVADARALLGIHPGITARDAIHAAIIRRYEIEVVYSYDRHLDGIDGFRRLEPA